MKKKVYHGFDIEEEDLTGIDEIFTGSSTCKTETVIGYANVSDIRALDGFRDTCANDQEYYDKQITVNFNGIEIG